jgi:hypothetical protein
MTPEHREAIRAANRRRASYVCQKCRRIGVREVDGSDPMAGPGFLPGVKYRVCDGCGHVQPITHRPRKPRL